MDRLGAMRVFITVAETGSLTAAARQLGRPLTTISRQLAALEAHVGASLVARSTRRLALTETGRDYLDACRRILDELESAESRITREDDTPSGELAITAPVVFGRLHILPILTRFLALHPRIAARMHLTDRIVDLTEEGLDVALRIGALPDSALIATRVGQLTLVTCASPAYLRARGTPATPADLKVHDCIGFMGLPSEGRWHFKSARHGRHTVRIRSRLSVTTAEAAVDAATSGLGLTRVLSYQAEAALARKRLVSVLGAFDDSAIPVHLVRRPVRIVKPAVRLFLAHAGRELKGRLAKAGLAPGSS